MPHTKTIRIEDLGPPVQELLKKIKNITDDEMQLFEYVSVKDMAKIYTELGSDRQADVIWGELRENLRIRREQEIAKAQEIERKREELTMAHNETIAEESNEKKDQLNDIINEAGMRSDHDKCEEEIEAERQAEKKKKRREAKKRAIEREMELLREKELAKAAKKHKTQKKQWEDYVSAHPLEFSNQEVIEQKSNNRTVKPPPNVTQQLLDRTYTANCPKCKARFSHPPPFWTCPLCLRRNNTEIKVWQPDTIAECAVCNNTLWRFKRHHCRNCGRAVCNSCSPHQAIIPYIHDEKTPVRVCTQCFNDM